jgi:hypothetical protein
MFTFIFTSPHLTFMFTFMFTFRFTPRSGVTRPIYPTHNCRTVPRTNLYRTVQKVPTSSPALKKNNENGNTGGDEQTDDQYQTGGRNP